MKKILPKTLSFLISLILVSTLLVGGAHSSSSSKIPDWVRSIFAWYGEDKISEDELINAIKFLIQNNIIQLEQKEIQPSNQSGTSVTTNSISVFTDKPSYQNGESILVSGTVKAIIEETPVTVQILDPEKNIVQISSVNVKKDGTYSTTIKATGALWVKNGSYTVKAQYGSPDTISETIFEFTSTEKMVTKIFEVNTGSSGSFDVEFTVNGGSVEDMKISSGDKSLIILIDATKDGTISLKISRELIDAKTSAGDDKAFAILIDGAEVEAQQESTPAFRTITIQFLEGDSEIRIVGTKIAS